MPCRLVTGLAALASVSLLLACGAPGATTDDGTTVTGDHGSEFGWPNVPDVPDTTDTSTTGVEMPSACTAEPPTPAGSCYAQEIADIATISVAIGDFDGDGHLDLAATDEAETGVLFLRGDGTGALAGPIPFALASDNEAKGDVARFRGLTTMPSQPAARLFATARYPLAGQQVWWSNDAAISIARFMYELPGTHHGLFGDLDGDGDTDVVILGTGFVFESLCDPNGCEEPVNDSPQQVADANLGAALLDFDGDGRADLIDVNGAVRIRWWRNEGDGVFAPEPTVVDVGPHAGVGPESWTFVDLDGDGRDDLVFADEHPRAGWIQFHPWLRLDDGGFADAGYVEDVGDTAILVGLDLEGDGVGEVVQLRGDALTIWGATSGDALAPSGVIGFGDASWSGAPNSLASGDLDEDGMVDFALPISTAGTQALLLIRTGA